MALDQSSADPSLARLSLDMTKINRSNELSPTMMRQKSLLVAYSLDRAFLYFCVTSTPSSVSARDNNCFEAARLYSRIRRKNSCFLAAPTFAPPTYQFFRILADVTAVESRVPPDKFAFSLMRRSTGVLIGRSTFEPLARKASYIFSAPPK